MLTEKIKGVYPPVLAFAGAGIMMTLSNPFDLVRIRMQTMGELVQMGRLQKSYEGILDCARRVTREEGIRAFWKGNAANLTRFYTSQTFNFLFKQSIKRKLNSFESIKTKHTFIKNFFSGVLGSWFTLSFLYPIEHARNRLSNNISCHKLGIIRCIVKTIKTQGFSALYTGSLISMVGVAIFRGTYFGIFDTFKNNKNNLQRWALAYFSSLSAIMLTYPSDTVRRRLICNEKRQSKYKGFFDCLNKIYKKQGIKSFFCGGRIIFLQSLSSSGVLYLYDKINRDIRQYCY